MEPFLAAGSFDPLWARRRPGHVYLAMLFLANKFSSLVGYLRRFPLEESLTCSTLGAKVSSARNPIGTFLRINKSPFTTLVPFTTVRPTSVAPLWILFLRDALAFLATLFVICYRTLVPSTLVRLTSARIILHVLEQEYPHLYLLLKCDLRVRRDRLYNINETTQRKQKWHFEGSQAWFWTNLGIVWHPLVPFGLHLCRVGCPFLVHFEFLKH